MNDIMESSWRLFSSGSESTQPSAMKQRRLSSNALHHAQLESSVLCVNIGLDSRISPSQTRHSLISLELLRHKLRHLRRWQLDCALARFAYLDKPLTRRKYNGFTPMTPTEQINKGLLTWTFVWYGRDGPSRFSSANFWRSAFQHNESCGESHSASFHSLEKRLAHAMFTSTPIRRCLLEYGSGGRPRECWRLWASTPCRQGIAHCSYLTVYGKRQFA